MRRFIDEPIGDEILVYDTEMHRAHSLPAKVAKRWRAAKTDLARRRVLVAFAASIASIVAPVPAQAASCVATCGPGDNNKPCVLGGACRGTCRGRRCQ